MNITELIEEHKSILDRFYPISVTGLYSGFLPYTPSAEERKASHLFEMQNMLYKCACSSLDGEVYSNEDIEFRKLYKDSNHDKKLMRELIDSMCEQYINEKY